MWSCTSPPSQGIPPEPLLDGGGPEVRIGPLGGTRVRTQPLVLATDAQGAAAVRVVLGPIAGTAAVQVTVPQAGLTDTVRYRIRPGAPYGFEVQAGRDTALQVGTPFTYVAQVVDRRLNARPDTLRYTTSATRELTVTPHGTVTALAPVRAPVVATLAGLLADTLWVSAVPRATVVVQREDTLGIALGVMALDGTGFRRVPLASNDGPPGALPLPWGRDGARWSADGQSLLVNSRDDVSRVALDGTRETLVRADVHQALLGWPQTQVAHLAGEAPDGWLYYAVRCGGAGGPLLYRTRGGGSPERLSPPVYPVSAPEDVGLDCGLVDHASPSLSPDGRRLVIVDFADGVRLLVLDVTTRALTTLPVRGFDPQWSPSGDRIVYNSVDGSLWTVRADGSDARRVPTRSTDLSTATWSPAGEWLLAQHGLDRAKLTLIEVHTGREIPLPYSYLPTRRGGRVFGYGLPDWRAP